MALQTTASSLYGLVTEGSRAHCRPATISPDWASAQAQRASMIVRDRVTSYAEMPDKGPHHFFVAPLWVEEHLPKDGDIVDLLAPAVTASCFHGGLQTRQTYVLWGGGLPGDAAARRAGHGTSVNPAEGPHHALSSRTPSTSLALLFPSTNVLDNALQADMFQADQQYIAECYDQLCMVSPWHSKGRQYTTSA